MARNGKIILAKNIKLDKEYQNVLTYSETDMLTLVTTNNVAMAEDYSFIRETGRIRVGFPYSVSVSANYMAFQNPDYSGKWFFAFIDKVNFGANGTSEIEYTVDIFSTWWSYWDSKPCFVVREHVNDDTVGANTMAENLETGEYICNLKEYYDGFDELLYMIQATEDYDSSVVSSGGTNFGGVFLAGVTLWADTFVHFLDVLNLYSGKQDAIYNCYMIPKKFVRNIPENPTSYRWSGQTSPYSDYMIIDKPTTLDTYTPRNNKLLTFPYSYLLVSNNNGSSNIYHYERFYSQEYPNHCDFEIKGVPVVGGSFKLVPYDYDYAYGEECGLMAGKFPALNWSEDTYTNWLTQNAVNLAIGQASAVLESAGGIITGNPVSMISGGLSMVSQMGQKYQHALIQHTAKGNTNGGDINVCSESNGFYFYHMSVKREFAKSIDDYFDRQGYSINRVKLPNQTGRTYWNYVQIAGGELLAYQKENVTGIPANDLASINKLYQRGITLWHNHDNIGNYNLINNIITP